MTMASDPKEVRPDAYTARLAAEHDQNRERDGDNHLSRTEPLKILDLPLDVLQAIIREITHTNDLTSLALTHSTLHALVIPHIYSRFDIVWPDAGPTVDSRVGVDALTYGLATLVMAGDVYGEGVHQPTSVACSTCGCLNFCRHQSAPARVRKIRRGNNFAQYTRKFSLGNGPEDWVKEYLINKEGGKMLGTLVALAIGRMRNLESFAWDMPTGVLRDVWLALASLDGRDDGQECRLERVWVRWHDNQDTLVSPPPPGVLSNALGIPHLVSGTSNPMFQIPHYPRVVFPTFSVLPPLKSLTVLDIDELSYIEEMSVLIGQSLSRLQELRIGIAHHAQNRPWTRAIEDRSSILPPLMPSDSNVMRKGGLIGVLVSRFCPTFGDTTSEVVPVDDITKTPQFSLLGSSDSEIGSDARSEHQRSGFNESDVDHLGDLLSAQRLENEPCQTTDDVCAHNDGEKSILSGPEIPQQSSQDIRQLGEANQKKLRLEVLELERVSLSVPALSRAFDWSRIRTLTILSCREHEQLWKALRKRFTPTSHARTPSMPKLSTSSNQDVGYSSTVDQFQTTNRAEYNLCITRIHTDAVSAALLAFLKDALAPDTLEYLFLQQTSVYKSVVTIDQIYKYAVRRHRGSLRKLLIDSNVRIRDGSLDGALQWRRWAASRELITCITSGRMRLRELSMSVDYKDWHYFLQRLPNASTIRSLHISHIADNRVDTREAALQVLDIIALRPDLELCYLGIQGKCFEILEYPSNRKSPPTPREPLEIIPSAHLEDDEISDSHDDPEHEVNDHDSDDLNLVTDHEDVDDTEDEAMNGREKTALRLREILFYDDKISIFKARHGRL